MIFGIKKIYNFDPYNVLLAIATNIPVLLMTSFVVQGHIYAFGRCFFILRKSHWVESIHLCQFMQVNLADTESN